jgi:predicted nucleic acid-binding protein
VLVYLDSSAIVKLTRREPETRALLAYLSERPERVTSAVSAVEVARAARQSSVSRRAVERADRLLARIGIAELDAPVRARAGTLEPASLRSLDAIHIATALELGADIENFVTYDQRQSAAAQQAGLTVVAPS